MDLRYFCFNKNLIWLLFFFAQTAADDMAFCILQTAPSIITGTSIISTSFSATKSAQHAKDTTNRLLFIGWKQQQSTSTEVGLGITRVQVALATFHNRLVPSSEQDNRLSFSNDQTKSTKHIAGSVTVLCCTFFLFFLCGLLNSHVVSKLLTKALVVDISGWGTGCSTL